MSLDQMQVNVEHRGAFAAVGLAFQLLQNNEEPLARLVRSAEHMESVGIVLNPTMLRDFLYSKNAQKQVAIARLVLKFVRELRAEIAELPKEAADVAADPRA